MTSALDDIFARLRDEAGIDRVSYFHCDHFEPWRWSDDRDGVDQRNADDVLAFCEAMTALPYAKRLTLFTKSPIPASLVGRHGERVLEGDEISFPRLGGRRADIHREALRGMVAAGHELQVHIHHERFTRNDWYSTSPERPDNAVFREFLSDRSTPEMDEARFSLYLELTLRLFRRASGMPLRPWMFVHGMWSLNGSDRDYCCIDREIAILQKYGCVADFTFPAPRVHCNPGRPAPYLCRPVTAAKGYDHPDAQAETAAGQPADGRFFLWSTDLRAGYCSLDTTSHSFVDLAADPAEWARALIAGGAVHGGAVHVKTHAHSMMPGYFDGLAKPAYPHAHPAVQAMFGQMMAAAARAGLAFELSTADEIYRRFVTPDAPVPLPARARMARPEAVA